MCPWCGSIEYANGDHWCVEMHDWNERVEQPAYFSDDYPVEVEQKIISREKTRFRVTQAATKVSDEFAAHEGAEQYSSAITVALTVGFAASEALTQGSWEEYSASRAVFDEFLAGATEAVEAAHAYYKQRGFSPRRARPARSVPQPRNPQYLGDNYDLPF